MTLAQSPSGLLPDKLGVQCWGVRDQGCDESLDEVFLSPPTSRPHLPVVYLWASLWGLLRTLGGVFDASGRLLGAIWEHVVSVYACSGVRLDSPSSDMVGRRRNAGAYSFTNSSTNASAYTSTDLGTSTCH